MKMKTKHNKKRNTAFIFEALVREMAKAVVAKNSQTKRRIAALLHEHFSKGSLLERELQCYRALSERASLDKYNAEKLIHRTKEAYSQIDKKELFKEQSRVISKINKRLGRTVFSNFIPNYKDFATIAHIFNDSIGLKQKVLMEEKVLNILRSADTDEPSSMQTVDSLVVTKFTKKFNEQYRTLLPEQRNLLGKYILAVGDNMADFQCALVAELKRLHEAVEKSLRLEEVRIDPEMVKNTELLLERLKKFNVTSIADKELRKILQIQSLVREYTSDADNY